MEDESCTRDCRTGFQSVNSIHVRASRLEVYQSASLHLATATWNEPDWDSINKSIHLGVRDALVEAASTPGESGRPSVATPTLNPKA